MEQEQQKITEKTVSDTLLDGAYILVTQQADGVEVLRRVPLSVLLQKCGSDDNALEHAVATYLTEHPPEDGGHYTPTVTQDEVGTATFSWAASRNGMPAVQGKTVTLPAGVSPTLSVAAIDGGHRITITDVTGTRYVDVPDGQDAAVTATNIAAALGYTPANAADVHNLSVFVTPQMFGAVGDNVTDDTAALKKCFEHTNIFIPAGKYVVSETIDVLPRTQVVGEGQYQSFINFTGDILFNVQEYASFSDINIGGDGGGTAIVFPFKFLRLHNIRFRYLDEAVRSEAENVLYNTFVDCTFSNVKYPFIFPNATIFNTSIMQNLEFKNYSAVVTLPGTFYAISFDRCIFEGGEAGNYVLDVAEPVSVAFDSCYYENHGELVSGNAEDGNITLRSTWICVPNTTVLSMAASRNLCVKFVDSTIENLNSDDETFNMLIDGTNLVVDLVDCMTKSPTATRPVQITTADIASKYGVATGCTINGGYLTLDTLPVYDGEVE